VDTAVDRAQYWNGGAEGLVSLDPYALWASLVFGTVGVAYLIYGKKQGRIVPALGGIVIIGVSYFLSTGLSIAVVSLCLMGAIAILARRYD